MKLCGGCAYFEPERDRCAIGASYAAFVYPGTEAHGCPMWHDKERAAAERAMQSQCRPVEDETFVAGVKVQP